MREARVRFADRLAFVRELKEASSFLPTSSGKRDEEAARAREKREADAAILTQARTFALEEMLHHVREYVDASTKHAELSQNQPLAETG